MNAELAELFKPVICSLSEEKLDRLIEFLRQIEAEEEKSKRGAVNMSNELYIKLRSLIVDMHEDDIKKLLEYVNILREKNKKECIENEVHK